jgi:hypothetical protein
VEAVSASAETMVLWATVSTAATLSGSAAMESSPLLLSKGSERKASRSHQNLTSHPHIKLTRSKRPASLRAGFLFGKIVIIGIIVVNGNGNEFRSSLRSELNSSSQIDSLFCSGLSSSSQANSLLRSGFIK